MHKDFKDLGQMIDEILNEIPNFFEKTRKERKEAMRDVFNKDFDAHFKVHNTNRGRKIAPMNIVESSERIDIELAAPGRSKERFHVHLEGEKTLVIGYENVATPRQKGTTQIRKEWKTPSFKRTYQVPDHVDASQITAKYEQGVLKLSLPKKARKKKSSIHIEVN